jgi:hypothetical protein
MLSEPEEPVYPLDVELVLMGLETVPFGLPIPKLPTEKLFGVPEE